MKSTEIKCYSRNGWRHMKSYEYIIDDLPHIVYGLWSTKFNDFPEKKMVKYQEKTGHCPLGDMGLVLEVCGSYLQLMFISIRKCMIAL